MFKDKILETAKKVKLVETAQKVKIIETGKRLYERHLACGTSGNISLKTEDGILITASGTALGGLTLEGVVLIDDAGNEISTGRASSEKMLHVEIYKKRPDVNAIIHVHSPYLTSFAVCHKALNEPIMSENILFFEDIPVAEYAMPSSMELVNNTIKYFENRDVVMMANHGVVICADTMENAFLKAESAEHYAQIALNTKILGGAKLLSEKDVQDLINLKNQ